MMAEFADIFIAKNQAEAAQYDPLIQNYPHISVNGLTDYEISALWASLSNSHVKEIHELEFIEIEADGVLYQLPEPFLAALVALDDTTLFTAAAIWAEHEEVHWRRQYAKEKLEEIRELAKQAQHTQQQLYLMVS